MRRLIDIGIIFGVASALALLSFAIRPNVVPWNVSEYEIELEAALALEQAIWIDARASEDFERGSYADSLSVNEENWEAGFVSLLDMWNPDLAIIVFCSSQSCLRSHNVASRLREELGVEEIYTLKDGWESLVEAGLVR